MPLEILREPVPLTVAMRGIGGREKPWGPVVRALLEGEWAYALSHTGNVVREIVVEGTDVAAIRETAFDPLNWTFEFGGDLSQTDACDVLNVPLRSRGRIERHKTCNRNGSWVFDRKALGALAVSIVTSSELGARHLLENKTTTTRIARADLGQFGFGYERATAIARFDAETLTTARRDDNRRRPRLKLSPKSLATAAGSRAQASSIMP